jgi:hypothetical protein
MNYVHMKTTELKTLRKLVKSGGDRPLKAADLALLVSVWVALRAYEAETGQERGRTKGVSRFNAGGVGNADGKKGADASWRCASGEAVTISATRGEARMPESGI